MRRRRPRSVVLLRRVPVDSAVHRLWAGTKLLAVAALSVSLSFNPTWAGIGLAGAVLLGAMAAGHIPASALPRPPLWFWAALALGAAVTAVAGLAALVDYVQFVLISIELLGAAAIIGWTTDLGEIGPALATLLGPLRRLRLPTDEWAATTALSIRCLPLVVTELRTLAAVVRMRPRPQGARSLQTYLDEAGGTIVTALAVSLRRAAEMAEAITSRGGGSGVLGRSGRPGRYDVVAAVVVAAACAGAWALPA